MMLWLLIAYFCWNYCRALDLLHAVDDPAPLGDNTHPYNWPFFVGIWFVVLFLLFGGVIDILRLIGGDFGHPATAKEPTP